MEGRETLGEFPLIQSDCESVYVFPWRKIHGQAIRLSLKKISVIGFGGRIGGVEGTKKID